MESKIITNDDRRAKYYRWMAYARRIAKFLPQLLQLVCVIAFIPLIMSLTPYIDGSEELETAFTTSQLTAMLVVLVLCYGVLAIGRIGRR